LTFARRLIRERQLQTAIQVCRTALKESDPTADLHETLGRALLLSGDAEASLWHFLQTTLLAPKQLTGYVNLGAAYNQLKKFGQAVETLTKAVKLGGNAAAYYNLGLAHRNLNNLPSAKTAYREALRLDPNLVEAHLNVARVYTDLRDFTLAIAHFQKALELRPSFSKAAEGLRKATLALSQPTDPLADSDRSDDDSKPGPAIVVLEATPRSQVDPTRARFLGRDIARAANDLRQHFENTVIPLLNQMRRLVLEGRSNSIAYGDHQREYRAACQHNAQLRKTLRQLMVRLFAADELARTSTR
jgi:tetratricopeptide (TPR) repeat protein